MDEIIIQRYDSTGHLYGCSIYDADYDCSNAIRQLRQVAQRTGTKIKVFRSDDKSNSREKYNRWCDTMRKEEKCNERMMKEAFMQ